MQITNGQGATLRAMREARGWSQQHLAEKAGISVPMVSRLESGHREPSRALVFVLATLFNVRQGEVESWFDKKAA